MRIKKIFLLILIIPQFGFGQTTALYDTIFDSKNTSKINLIMRSEGILKDNFKIGIWKTWYPNGQLSDSGQYNIVVKSNIRVHDSDSTFFQVDTNYIRGRIKEKYSFPVGKWVSYYSNGKIKNTGTYLPFGFVEAQALQIPAEGDSLKFVYTFTFPEGMKTGIWKLYDENGKIEEQENYVNGVFVGDIPIE